MAEQKLKEIKVRIPVDHHIKLHSIRLMMEQNISDTVQKALETYFDMLRQRESKEVEESQNSLDAYLADAPTA